MAGYSIEADPETTAKAIGKELHISPKHCIEICNLLRGKTLVDAKHILEEVIELKRPVPFRRHKRYVAHKRGKGFGAGRYPVNASAAILRILADAEHNAEYKGLDPEIMKLTHISSNLGKTYQGWRPRARGRSSPWNTETVNIEVILEEMEE